MRSKFKWIFTLLIALTMQFSYAQEKTVTGVVSDNSGPLPGANVVVQGSKTGTQTDVDGKFSIKAKAGDVLVFSFVGMTETTAKVGASNTVNVKMQDGVKLDEVIVGAMGIKRSKDATVSAQKQIGAAELTQANNPNAVAALTGKVSGLSISSISNGVSPTLRIVLRGSRSITGNNEALVVIDNVISTANNLQLLQPDAIENVNVIKGAQGAALYGAQGVNGVIIVTTKKGSKTEKMTVGLNSSVDYESVNFVANRQQEYGQGWANDSGFNFPNLANGNPDPRNGSGFVTLENGSWGPAFTDPRFVGQQVPVGLPQANGQFFMTDWKPIKDNIKQFYQTGVTTQNGFDVNIGGLNSYITLGVNKRSSSYVVDGDQLAKTSFNLRAGKTLGKLKIDGTVNYAVQTTSQTDSNLLDDLLQTAINIPVSRFANSGNEGHWTVYAQNPYWMSKANRNDSRTDFFNGSVALGYEINNHISANYTANIQLTAANAQSHADGWFNENYVSNFGAYSYGGVSQPTLADLGQLNSPSSFSANQQFTSNIYSDLIFNFNYDLSKDLNLKFNVGNNIQDRTFRITSQGGDNLDVPGFYHITNVLNPYNPSSLDNRLVQTRRVAGFVNADFDYKNYLFLNATSRVEEISTVKKSYFYPSVGVSFVPTKAFDGLKNDVLNYLKVNASWTKVGNVTAVGAYQTNDLVVLASGFPFGSLGSLAYNTAPTDPNIRPEFVTTTEFGAQIGLFNDKINLEASYYVAKTSDLITRATSSSASGNANLLTNIGDLENKGFEIDLGFSPVKTKDFKWDVKTNYSTAKTKIIALAAGATSVNLLSNSEVGVFAEVGEEFPLIKGTAFVRSPDGRIVVNADGTPQKTSTFEKLGKGTPDYILGFTNSFDYKGLKLTIVGDYRTGASAYSEAKRLLLFTGGDLETAGFDRTQGYVVPNSVQFNATTNTYTANTTPGLGANYASTLNFFTTTWRTTGEANIVDAAALKIREIALSYSLPKEVTSKLGLSSFKLGVNARNPFVFLADGSFLSPKNGGANNGYFDPEASYSGGNAQGYSNIGQYPTTRTFGASINLTF
jgi:TonB-linked SusC/RagA family outer membrane protein